MKKIILTGGCGFIGRNLVLRLLKEGNIVINVDKLTYASKNRSFKIKDKNYVFFKKDINDKKFIKKVFRRFEPDLLINVAAESRR